MCLVKLSYDLNVEWSEMYGLAGGESQVNFQFIFKLRTLLLVFILYVCPEVNFGPMNLNATTHFP